MGRESAAAPTLTVHDLYRSFFDNSPARLAAVVKTSHLSIESYYNSLFGMVDDQVFVFNNMTLHGSREKLLAEKADYQALSRAYASMGDYWQAIGYDPAQAVSEDTVTEALLTAHSAEEGPDLSLVDLTQLPEKCNINDKVPPPPQEWGVTAHTNDLPKGGLIVAPKLTAWQILTGQKVSDRTIGIYPIPHPVTATAKAAYLADWIAQFETNYAKIPADPDDDTRVVDGLYHYPVRDCGDSKTYIVSPPPPNNTPWYQVQKSRDGSSWSRQY